LWNRAGIPAGIYPAERKFNFPSQTDRMYPDRRQASRRDSDRRGTRPPEASAWKRQLSDLLHAGLQHAKFEQNIEIDLLASRNCAEISDSGNHHAIREPHARSQGVDSRARGNTLITPSRRM